MKENFDLALEFVFRHEGRYVNDPNDPGGETKYGISKRAYPQLDIRNLTKEDAAKIYKRDYWDRMGGDRQPFPFDIILFDTAVNCGVGRATRWLGKAVDGHDYLFLRLKHYSAQRNPRFLRGWLNRVIDLHDFIQKIKRGEIQRRAS